MEYIQSKYDWHLTNEESIAGSDLNRIGNNLRVLGAESLMYNMDNVVHLPYLWANSTQKKTISSKIITLPAGYVIKLKSKNFCFVNRDSQYEDDTYIWVIGVLTGARVNAGEWSLANDTYAFTNNNDNAKVESNWYDVENGTNVEQYPEEPFDEDTLIRLDIMIFKKGTGTPPEENLDYDIEPYGLACCNATFILEQYQE